jgi:hypothetical protein
MEHKLPDSNKNYNRLSESYRFHSVRGFKLNAKCDLSPLRSNVNKDSQGGKNWEFHPTGWILERDQELYSLQWEVDCRSQFPPVTIKFPIWTLLNRFSFRNKKKKKNFLYDYTDQLPCFFRFFLLDWLGSDPVEAGWEGDENHKLTPRRTFFFICTLTHSLVSPWQHLSSIGDKVLQELREWQSCLWCLCQTGGYQSSVKFRDRWIPDKPCAHCRSLLSNWIDFGFLEPTRSSGLTAFAHIEYSATPERRYWRFHL